MEFTIDKLNASFALRHFLPAFSVDLGNRVHNLENFIAGAQNTHEVSKSPGDCLKIPQQQNHIEVKRRYLSNGDSVRLIEQTCDVNDRSHGSIETKLAQKCVDSI